jgi:glycosyltransferase involved in cell wall biosynthesis
LRVKLAFRLLQQAVHRAGRIITVSQATRHTLETLLPEAKGKTSVIYHGVDAHFVPLPVTQQEEVKRATRLGRFVLYVGNNKPHKNLPQLVRAFIQVRSQGHDIQLVLLGVAPSTALPPLEGVHMLPAVTDAQLVHWYNAADICVLPSLNEGFGLSALEAMACGTPVVAANVASLPEVIGAAGILVSPYDTQDLADALGRLLSDPDLRCHLRELGLKQARRFSWTTAAQQTLQVYRQVAGR